MKNNIIRRLAAAAVFSAAVCLTSCGSGESSSDTQQTTAPAASISEAVGTSAETTTEAQSSGGIISAETKAERVPEAEVNVSSDVKLSTVNINGVEVDISNITLDEFLEKTGLVKGGGNSSYVFKEFKFDGKLFTPPKSEDDKSNVSVAVEVIDENGDFVKGISMKEENYSKYRILGLQVSDFAVNDDFRPSFTGGITIGSTADEIKDILGEPQMMNRNFCYSNGSQTMVICFTDAADEIFFINNIQ